MSILLTGTGGYLGALLERHLAPSFQLCAIPGRKDFAAQVRQAVAREHPLEIVIHCGFEIDFARGGKEGAENLTSMRTLLDLLPPHVYFIYLSGAAVFGVGQHPMARAEAMRAQCDPFFHDWMESRYVKEKLVTEDMLREGCENFLILNLTTCFGPGMNQALVRRPRGRVRLVPPGGSSFLDERDFLTAIDLAIAQRPRGQYLLSGGNFTFAQFFGVADELWGDRRRNFVLPTAFARGVALIPMAMRRSGFWRVLLSSFGYKHYSAAAFCRATGWVPRHGLRECLATLPVISGGGRP